MKLAAITLLLILSTGCFAKRPILAVYCNQTERDAKGHLKCVQWATPKNNPGGLTYPACEQTLKGEWCHQ